jgi:hypothetical protein
MKHINSMSSKTADHDDSPTPAFLINEAYQFNEQNIQSTNCQGSISKGSININYLPFFSI